MAHSYSSISQFENCAHQYHQVRVLKRFPYVQSPEAVRGEEVHRALELLGMHGTPLPADMQNMTWVSQLLDSIGGQRFFEVDLSVNKQYEPVDKWAWKLKHMTGKADVLFLDGASAVVLDYKTGKVSKFTNDDQLRMLCLLVFALHPEVMTVAAALVYVPGGELFPANGKPLIITRASYEAMKSEFESRIKAIDMAQTTGVWPKQRSGLCGWCDVVDCENNTKGSR